MTRLVYPNDMVAHLWANQSQAEARTANGNLFFEGPILYSYGRHYVAGYVLPCGAALINGRKYSVTTSGHVSDARRAARGRAYTIPNLDDVTTTLRSAAINADDPARLQQLLKGFDVMVTGEKAPAALPKDKEPRALEREASTAHGRGADLAAPYAAAEAIALIRAAIDPRTAPNRSADPDPRAVETATRLIRQRAANAAGWRAYAARVLSAAHLALACEVGRQDLGEVRKELRAAPRQSGFYLSTATARVADMLKRLRKARAAANKRGFVHLAQAVKARMEALREESAAWEARADFAARFGTAARYVRNIRAADSMAARIKEQGAAVVLFTLAAPHGGDWWHGYRKARDVLSGGASTLRDVSGRLGAARQCRIAAAFRLAGWNADRISERTARYESALSALMGHERRTFFRGHVAALRAFDADPADLEVCRAAQESARMILSERFGPSPFRKAGWTGAEAAALQARIATALETARYADESVRVAKWEAGHGPASLANYGGPIALRIKGDVLQTSRGAEVPLAHAVRVFRFLRYCREHGKGWQANGRTLPVGHFRVDSVTAEGDFRAGCHSVTFAAVERAARAAGLWETVTAAVTTEGKAAAHV